MKIKILHCITDLSPDGAQRALLRLLQQMNKDRFDNYILALKSGGSLQPAFEKLNVPIVNVSDRAGIPSLRTFSNLIRAIRSIQPNILQGWMYHGNLAAAVGKICAFSSATLCWNIRRCLYDEKSDKLLTRIVINIGGLISRFPRKIIYCVEKSADHHESIGYSQLPRIVIPNGFDTHRFRKQRGAGETIRKEIGISAEHFVVGIIGRYHPQKDYPTFLEAAKHVILDRQDVRFVMVGRGIDRSNVELAALIRDLQLEPFVHLLGERQDVPEVLSAIDIFCSSSANEGFANVVGEAMSCQVPCVVTDAGASRELVQGLGEVLERGNAAALATGIVSMLSLGKEGLAERGILGRDRIIQHYSLKGMISAYQRLYSDPEIAGHLHPVPT